MLIKAPTYAPPYAPPLIPEEVAEPTAKDVLLRAIDLLDERGWTRCTWVSEDGEVCLLGAVGVASLELGFAKSMILPDAGARIGLTGDDLHRVNVHHASTRFFDSFEMGLSSLMYHWNDAGGKFLAIGAGKKRVKKALRYMADGMHPRKAIHRA